ncbi:hypothetical protein LZT09_01470 [Vibrio fluvialis]|uniref:hypothetical protein n=1 Tax=Vibrio fluvialis TaxID=676 RepID=UPI001C9C4CB6|nr:hypothetical protein [Vibrio fluvialis]EKO3408858.1 hypothetical protein [Vibrio fluvialis]ELP2651751.1 hypothetical protein [Vibrio fluvialis]EMC0407001.1 hypothetical protein [Vibrio fluvialis]MBY7896041.1 hypothetical protein [Vibrio fluvialis]MBY8034802.1 hypothetical protein [Vibrio fluvialis]
MKSINTLLLATCVSLTGCASAPNISLDKSLAGKIETAELLRVSESQYFMVKNLSGLSGLGGAIGGAISGISESDRTETFVNAYNENAVHLTDELVAALEKDLNQGGIQVTYKEDDFAKLNNGHDDYSHINSDQQTLLSVWFGPVGYIADGVIDAPYEPWLFVNVRLLDAKTKQVLSQKSYTAGYKALTKGAVFVPCAESYRFNTFETIMDNFPKSIEGLSMCVKAVSEQATKDLL